MSYIASLLVRYKRILLYGSISVLALLVDVAVTRSAEALASGLLSGAGLYVLPNTLGVVTGFAAQYALASRHVFNSRNRRTFVVYVATAVCGMLLANAIVYFVRAVVFNHSAGDAAFYTAKGFSIAVPFFAMYFTRLKLIKPDKGDICAGST
jgi:putative flippase GtrA